jgi:hypothetical protein
MMREARVTDSYISPIRKHEYRKVQILTIEDPLIEKRPEMPPTINAFQEAPLTQRASKSQQQQTLFT